MIRYPSFLVVFLIVVVGISLYQIKFFITQNEAELKTIKTKTPISQTNPQYIKRTLCDAQKIRRKANNVSAFG